MKLTNEKLRWLAAQASTLRERMDGSFVPCNGGESDGKQRLLRWREVTANNTPQEFALLQQTFGCRTGEENSLLALLGNVRLSDEHALPSWAVLLDELVHCTSHSFAPPERLPRLSRAASSIPYAHLYWPIVQHAHAQVERSYPGTLLLDPKAWRGLEAYLYDRIASIVSTTLHPTLLAHRAVSASGVAGYFSVAEAATGRTDYQEFVQEQGEDGLASFFLRYPVAGRLVSEVTRLWIEFVGEFLTRLEQDAIALSVQFNDGSPLEKVSAITAGISDPHRGGRSVLVLAFAGGRRIVYKARSLGIEQAFYRLVQALNERHGGINLRTMRVLDCGGYGWMEFVPRAPCSTTAAARRYYRRAGALVGLVHWLQGIDFHRENVVATGEHPVLVDLEALVHPMQTNEEPPVTEAYGWPLGESALRTGLLPLWHSHPTLAGAHYDNCGLDARINQPDLYPSALWRNVNTDQMQLSFAHRSRCHDAHRPTMGGRVLTIKAFQEDVLTGYSQMAKVLEGPDHSRFAEHRVLIADSPRRCIKRPTRVYNLFLRHSIQPQFLKTGVDRSIELWALTQGSTSNTRELVEEISCLERLDVPYFQVENTQGAPALQTPDLNSQLCQIRLALQRRLVLKAGWIRLAKG